MRQKSRTFRRVPQRRLLLPPSRPGGPIRPEFYTLPVDFVRDHLDVTSTWEKVHLKPLRDQIAHFRDEAGFDQIARRLGVPPPTETIA